jgi:precorrin isomerase
MRRINTDPLYVAATIAQAVLEQLTHRVATLEDMPVVRETIERLDAARSAARHRTQNGEPDLSLFEEALRDVEIDL